MLIPEKCVLLNLLTSENFNLFQFRKVLGSWDSNSKKSLFGFHFRANYSHSFSRYFYLLADNM